MVVGVQNEILDGLHRVLFIRLTVKFEKRPQLSASRIFVLYSDVHFESHLPGNRLYIFE